AAARRALCHPLGFMLAQPLPTAGEVVRRLPAPFVLEDKYDGIRAQAHVAGGRVVLFSRTLDDVTSGYPEVVEALAGLAEGLVLDGELLAMDPAAPLRALPFKALQQRLGRQRPPAAAGAGVLRRVGRPGGRGSAGGRRAVDDASPPVRGARLARARGPARTLAPRRGRPGGGRGLRGRARGRERGGGGQGPRVGLRAR